MQFLKTATISPETRKSINKFELYYKILGNEGKTGHS
jgi:hypothetical protein